MEACEYEKIDDYGPAASSSFSPSVMEKPKKASQKISRSIGFNTYASLEVNIKDEIAELSFFSIIAGGGAEGANHAISFPLLLEFLSKSVSNYNLVDVPYKARSLLESMTAGVSYPALPKGDNYPLCSEDVCKKLEDDLGAVHRQAYETGLREQRGQVVISYLAKALSCYDENAVEGDEDADNERDESIIVLLNVISRVLLFDTNVSHSQKKSLYDEVANIYYELIDIVAEVFGEKISKVENSYKGDIDKFFTDFSLKCNDAKLVGSLISGFLHFPKDNGGTKEDLIQLSKKCIEISFVVFPNLELLDKRVIAEGFLDGLVKKQGWDVDDLDIDSLLSRESQNSLAASM